MYAFLNKKIIIPLMALAFASTSVSIRAEDASLDSSYLEEGLKVPHIIRLMNNTHPLSHDLIGKEYTFHYRDDKNNSAYFVDGEYIEWWVPSEPVKRIRKVKYAAFKITDDIYFVTSHGTYSINPLPGPKSSPAFARFGSSSSPPPSVCEKAATWRWII